MTLQTEARCLQSGGEGRCAAANAAKFQRRVRGRADLCQAARASIRLGIESAKTNGLTRSAVCASPRQIGQCGALEPGGWLVPSSELTPLLLHKVSVPSTASTISGFLANEGAQQNALAKTLPSSATIANIRPVRSTLAKQSHAADAMGSRNRRQTER